MKNLVFLLVFVFLSAGCVRNTNTFATHEMLEPREWYELAKDEGYPYATAAEICPHVLKADIFWYEGYDSQRDHDMQAACVDGIRWYENITTFSTKVY